MGRSCKKAMLLSCPIFSHCFSVIFIPFEEKKKRVTQKGGEQVKYGGK